MVHKGRRAVSAANDHLRKGDFDFASSKAYFAIFRYLQAALLTKKLNFSKHSAVISAFNLHFIKPGIFKKHFSKYIERLFKDRQIGDYGYIKTIEREEATEDVKIAEEMLTELDKYLSDFMASQS